MSITAVSYAKAVVGVLRDHFPGLADPVTAEIITKAVRDQAIHPRDSFEVIVDDPGSANWRLKAGLRGDRRRVHLTCYRMARRDADVQLENTVNSALSAFGSGKETAR